MGNKTRWILEQPGRLGGGGRGEAMAMMVCCGAVVVHAGMAVRGR